MVGTGHPAPGTSEGLRPQHGRHALFLFAPSPVPSPHTYACLCTRPWSCQVTGRGTGVMSSFSAALGLDAPVEVVNAKEVAALSAQVCVMSGVY